MSSEGGEFRKCDHCETPIPPDAAGNSCPACMMMRGLFGDEDSDLIEEHTILSTEDQGESEIKERPLPFGERIDRYRLISCLGEGGMGSVYEAEQIEPVVRKVAIKVIKLGMDTNEVIARFEAERQALALMNHPGIAKVLDAGATPIGTPYFVMELVDGESITDFCSEQNLSLTDRLGLFADVCAAVQHAHQKGILHRDLKPSNILITIEADKPTPKIIDFGIAKAVDPGLADVSLLITRGERMIGTPEYMSPEQAAMSSDIDTRSDIYALGLVLYELLTNQLPFDRQTGDYQDFLERVRDLDPPLPSTRFNEEVRDLPFQPRLLKGDLDWILLKAIEKDRERRYTSASEMAMDIERHLKNEPVFRSQTIDGIPRWKVCPEV